MAGSDHAVMSERAPDSDAPRRAAATEQQTGATAAGAAPATGARAAVPSPSATSLGARQIRAKSVVGAATDPAEREADHAADRALRMAAPEQERPTAVDPTVADATSRGPGAATSIPPEIQRSPAGSAASAPVPASAAPAPMSASAPRPVPAPPSESASAPPIRGEAVTDHDPHGGHVVPTGTERYLDQSQGTGSPLPDGTRRYFETRFSTDFRAVRVHDDAAAGQAAQSIGALAFTHGRDMWFSAGAYDPVTDGGRRLLAHELAHVAQQEPGIGRHAGERASRGAVGPAAASYGSRLIQPVQRFIGPEHAQLGDSTGASIDLGGGVVLTWGQVVAIAGDEYGSIDELEADAKTADGRARIRAALEHDQIPPSTIPSTLPSKKTKVASGKTAEEEQEARYNALAIANVSHFAAGGTAIETWTAHHQDALAKAVEAGIDGDEPAHQLALATEAFGEHFLTDSFSGGHVRTPRAAILDWYSTTFGPKVVIHLIDDLRRRLTASFAAQIAAQLPSSVGPAVPPLSELVSESVEKVILMIVGPEGLAVLGARLGTYIGGAVSGTLHDMEGERGVWVNSVAHPTPWVAYGDLRLAQSPVSETEAKAAIVVAKAQVEKAFDIGSRFRRTVAVPYSPPQTTYFGLNSGALDASARADCEAAGDYLRVHPEVTVNLVGHTCPLGPEAYNYSLGLRRATAVQTVLVGSGVDAARIAVSSMGENQLVTQDPKNYRLDRRVEFVWGANPVSAPSREYEEAYDTLAVVCPPPYQAILDRVPREVPDLNVALEDWHWGSMPKNLQTGFNTWVSVHIAPLVGGILADKRLDPIYPIPGTIYTIDPRAAIMKEMTGSKGLLADPIKYLNEAFGTSAGP